MSTFVFFSSPFKLNSVFSSHEYEPERLLVPRGRLLGGRELLLQILGAERWRREQRECDQGDSDHDASS